MTGNKEELNKMPAFLPTSSFMIRSNGRAYSLTLMLMYFDYACNEAKSVALDTAEAEFF